LDKAQGFENNASAADQKAAALANQSTAAKPVPHARLLAMVEGLSVGLSAFGTSMGTKGKEGGAPEVANYYAQKQNQEIEAQKARDAVKNTKIQQQIMVADTNHKLAQNVLFMHAQPNEMAKSDLEVSGKRLENIGHAQDIRTKALQDFTQTGDLKAYNTTLSKLDSNGGASTTAAPTAGGAASIATSAVPPVALANWTNSVDAAASAFPNDPAIQQARKVVADPNATTEQKALAANGATGRMNALTVGVKSRAEQQAADPLFKYQQDPAELAKPGAQAALSAYIADPANKDNINGLAQAKMLMTKADVAQANAVKQEGLKAQQMKNAEMLATAGDPKQAGQLLVEGTLTLADLKSRGSSPAQIIAATNAANAYAASQGKTYNASDEITGEQVLKGQNSQAFYGSARSLVQEGGMLDELKKAHDALGNQEIPKFNKIQDWLNYQAGTPELARYRQAVLGSSDDYAKVMGGGQPNQETYTNIRDGFANEMNNPQFDGAVDQARSAVRSQVTGRIGTNNYIATREGDILRDAPKAVTAPARPANVPATAAFYMIPGESSGTWITPESLAQAKKAHPNMVEVK
jgi:hypothetical protein